SRLAVRTARSPIWNLQRGRPQNESIDTFLKDIAGDPSFYPEWQTIFDRFRLTVRVSGIERGTIDQAHNAPDFDSLQKQGVNPGDRVPVDCLLWFSVMKQGEK